MLHFFVCFISIKHRQSLVSFSSTASFTFNAYVTGPPSFNFPTPFPLTCSTSTYNVEFVYVMKFGNYTPTIYQRLPLTVSFLVFGSLSYNIDDDWVIVF